MNDFITLICPTCGGKLQLTYDSDRFACSYCGNELLVKRSGNVISTSPVIQDKTRILINTDKTASELAIVRLQKEIAEIEEAKNKTRQHIIVTLNDVHKKMEVRFILADRRKNSRERNQFLRSANIDTYIQEIRNLSEAEYVVLKARYPKSITLRMIRTNLETITKFDEALREKISQLNIHHKNVSQL